MAKFYSPTSRGFYDDRIHHPSAIPADALPVSDEQHTALLEAQEDGKVIGVDDGIVVAQNPLPPAPEQLLHSLRRKRDQLLRDSDFTQIPDAPLSAEARAAWAAYRQALRDLPELYADDPAGVVWPAAPTEETQNVH